MCARLLAISSNRTALLDQTSKRLHKWYVYTLCICNISMTRQSAPFRCILRNRRRAHAAPTLSAETNGRREAWPPEQGNLVLRRRPMTERAAKANSQSRSELVSKPVRQSDGCDPQPGVVQEQYPRTAMCVRNVDVHVSCSSQVDAQLAAFFIDPRAK